MSREPMSREHRAEVPDISDSLLILQCEWRRQTRPLIHPPGGIERRRHLGAFTCRTGEAEIALPNGWIHVADDVLVA